MIKHIGFVANTTTSCVQACLDALYCAEKLGAAVNKFTITFNAKVTDSKNGISALDQEHLATLHNYGIDIMQLKQRCNGRFHYADQIRLGEHAGNWCSMAALGVVMQGVDFHHLLTKAKADGKNIDTSLASYSLNNSCQANEKQILPIDDKRDIRSSLKTQLHVNSDELFVFLMSILVDKKIDISFQPVDTLTNYYFSPADPTYHGDTQRNLRAVGAPNNTADFFFDYRFDASIKHYTAVRRAPFVAGICLKDSHIINIKTTANRTEIMALEGGKTPLEDTFKNLSIEQYERVENQPAECLSASAHATCLWHGNTIYIGQLTQLRCIAASFPVDVNALVLDHWINNMPSTATIGIVRKLAIQQFSQFAINLNSFALMPLFSIEPDNHLFCGELTQLRLQTIRHMKNRLSLFEHVGSEYLSDFDPIPRALWTNLMLSLNIWPQQFDIVAATISDSHTIVEKLENKIIRATEQLTSTAK
jgi:hypothetical protein